MTNINPCRRCLRAFAGLALLALALVAACGKPQDPSQEGAPPKTSTQGEAGDLGGYLAQIPGHSLSEAEFRIYVGRVNRVFNFNALKLEQRKRLVKEVFENGQLAELARQEGIDRSPEFQRILRAKADDFLFHEYEDKLARDAAVTDAEVFGEIDTTFGERVELWTIAMEDAAVLASLREELAAVEEAERREAFMAAARERSAGLTADRGGALGLVSTLDVKFPEGYVEQFLDLPVMTVTEPKPIWKLHYIFLVGEKQRREDIFRTEGERIRSRLFADKKDRLLREKLEELHRTSDIRIFEDRLDGTYEGPDADLVATVNGVEVRMKPPSRQHGGQRVFTPRQELNRLLTRLVLAQEARRVGLDQTPEFQAFLKLAADRELRTFYLQSRELDYAPPEEEIREYFEASTRSDLLEVGLVLLPTAEEARRVRGLLTEGKPFEEAVAQHSADRATKKRDGLWGRFQRGALEPELEEALYALPAGGYTEPLPFAGGYAVFKVLTRSPSPYTELTDDVRQVIVNRLKLQRKSAEVEERVRDISEALADLRIDEQRLTALNI